MGETLKNIFMYLIENNVADALNALNAYDANPDKITPVALSASIEQITHDSFILITTFKKRKNIKIKTKLINTFVDLKMDMHDANINYLNMKEVVVGILLRKMSWKFLAIFILIMQ